MKKSILGFGVCALALGGIAALVGGRQAVEARADDYVGDLYLRGTMNSWAAEDAYKLSRDGTAYSINNVTLAKGAEFKIADSTWEKYTLGAANRVSNETAVFFGSNGTNIKCNAAGTYNIAANTHDHSITISFVSSATYSYVLSSETAELTKAYLYKTEDTDELYAKADSPALASFGGGQAYNVKFGASDYALYKIDDRYINSFPKFKLTNLTEDSAEYTVSETQKVYVNGTSTKNSSSDEYLAAAFVYDVAAVRGAATYHETNFAFSICAVEQSVASALVSRYDAFSDGVKAILAATTIEVYDVSGVLSEYTKKDVAIPNIVGTLRTIAANKKDGMAVLPSTYQSESALPIVITVTVASLAVAGLLFFGLRKRKEKAE